MNKKILVVIISVIVILLVGYGVSKSMKNSNTDSHNINVIDVSNALELEFKKVPLSSIADSISYIKLQTNEECLIGKIRKPQEQIKIIEDRIFISDKSRLLSFDMSGNFITGYGHKGGGPGEYIDIRDFTILENSKQVVIYSPANKKAYFYKFSGEFIKSEVIDFGALNMASLDKNTLVFATPKGQRKKTNYNALTFLDINSNSKKEELTFLSEKDKNIAMSSNQNFFYVKDTLSFWEFHYDTIWRVTNSKPFAKYHINYPKKMPNKYLLEENAGKFEEQNKFIRLWNFVENSSYFFLRFGNGKNLNHICYNKKTKEQYNLRFDKDNEPGYYFAFYDDIDNGIPFWPIGSTKDDLLFSIVYPNQLLKEGKPKFKSEKSCLVNMYHSLQIDDNPIIMIIHPKK